MKILGVLLVGFLGTVSAVQAQEISWPQELGDDGEIFVLIYQPQVEVFTGNRLEARAAISVKTPSSGNAPVFGAIWIKAKLDTNRDTRTSAIHDIEISDVRITDASDEQKETLADFIEKSVEGSTLTISVDQLLADLDAAGTGVPEADLKHTPPKIILSTEPAMLIAIDGEPVLQDIEGSKYERVINCPFLIVKDERTHYLYVGSDIWYQAHQIGGPWGVTASVPADIKGLVEPAEGDAVDLDETKIVVATEPTELLVSDGDPSWAPVEGMNLLYMDNTDSNAFLELSTQSYYVLLSGRWYRGEGMIGELEWAHVPNDELPEAFVKIPQESVNGAVLSQVAGTQQARDAVLDNTIPQTAAIKRGDASFNVKYDGDPDFAPIENIKVEYAQNTAAAVFKYGNLYYACDNGVWYVANSAAGPWAVATEIPDSIYKIPASNPHHNVTYVKVYDATPEVVYVGYTPAYYGSYNYHGAVVYGTGWYYRPWYGPYYYPRYPTWGFHVTYNPWTGWGYGVSWTNGPFRFTFHSHSSWWGVGGYHPYSRPYVHGGYRKTNININVDNSINIGDRRDRPESRNNLYDRPENRARNAERPTRTQNARPASNMQNNVLTDHSGNVYQRSSDGKWSQRDNGQWKQPGNLDHATSSRATSQPTRQTATRPQLERDYNARRQGAQRTQSYQRQRTRRRR